MACATVGAASRARWNTFGRPPRELMRTRRRDSAARQPSATRAKTVGDADKEKDNNCSRGRALASTFAALTVASTSSFYPAAAAPNLDLNLESLTSRMQDVNKQLMRQVDPYRAYLDRAEIELESEIGPAGDPLSAPGVVAGDPEKGERDIVTTPSGLSYADVEIGHGDPIGVADLVVAHVVGTLESTGEEFENTYERGTALSFTFGVRPPGVTEGLEEGISTMRAGGTRLIAVPWSLGFGDKGVRAPKAFIPPYSGLRYEVQLLRCLSGVETPGLENGEKLCCSDANFPCDPGGLISTGAAEVEAKADGGGGGGGGGGGSGDDDAAAVVVAVTSEDVETTTRD